MIKKIGLITGFSAVLIAFSVWMWFRTVLSFEWEVVQQFYGHLGPAIFLVALGAAALFHHDNLMRLIKMESWLAIVAGALYVLADTFIMHPPWGVFDGAGKAENEHVTIMGLVMVLGISALVVMRVKGSAIPTSAHFAIGIAVASLVFLGHDQPTMAGTMGHKATVIMLVLAGAFRVLEKMTEYAIAIIVSGFVFYSSQMGFAIAMDVGGHSGGAWVAFWATIGFVAATGYLAMAPKQAQPAE